MKSKFKYHTDGSKVVPGYIFVFGSNESGLHNGGAALAAFTHYHARYGSGFGPMGWSFAIPTLDWLMKQLPLSAIKFYVERFIAHAEIEDSCYFITSLGCGIAGYSPSDIAPMFKNCAPRYYSFPDTWKEFLED